MSGGPSIRKLRAAENRATQEAAAPIFPAGYVASTVFHDFDQMAHAARNWDQEYAQLGRGAFRGSIRQAHTARMQVGLVSWSPGVLVQGQAPRGAVVFGLQQAGRERCYWRGAQTAEGEIIAMWRGQEVDFHANRPCELVVVSFEERLFAEHARALWDRPIEPGQNLGRALSAAPSAARAVLRNWQTLDDYAQRLGDSLCDARIARRLETDAVEALLTGAAPPAPEATLAERRRVAIRARRCMLEALEEPPTIKEICEMVGASERTLHQGFREAFGMSPKSFMKTLRLNAVRHALQHSHPTATVTSIAFHWGFFHLARFAADYRRMFGDLPSETLRRWRRGRDS